MKIVRNIDVKMETVESNVVKVQPNNCLINNESTNSSLIDLSSNLTNSSNVSPKIVINTVITDKNKSEHHYLCKKSSLTYEKSDCENNTDKSSAKNTSSDQLKGPRYCSMRLQSGTRNILLDNAHNNIPPVLYTRSNSNNVHNKLKNEPKLHHDYNNSLSNRSDDKTTINSISSENSVQNRQRVAEWIQNNSMENNDVERYGTAVEKSDFNDADKAKYAEMEENVKRFLFGESEFLKTVEIGKLKYQNYRESENSTNTNMNSKKSSLTETEI